MTHLPLSARHSRWPAAVVRQTFIDYFSEHEHRFVRSSPVLPRNDPTLPFVNAGMNQFKSVLTGHRSRPCPAAVNSQRCVRVGGKHNDLNEVGSDGHHHTFFEMLGSWSFNHYFKEKACTLAWRLLTDVYGLQQRHLYATYFAGDSRLGIPADLDTLNIWKQLGVSDDRIVSCGVDSLWEMGDTGPCGPCTELHYDRLRRSHSVAGKVNQGHSDVTELWNIVFMQFFRESDGSLSHLPEQHVDTGMGLERLTAILQSAEDNYGSDLFSPLFDVIHKSTGIAPYGGKYGAEDVYGADTAQRVLADHVRMCTVCLSDGVMPHANYRLRRILRRVFDIAHNRFGCEHLARDLASCCGDILSPAFPELQGRHSYMQDVLEAERQLWLQMCVDAASSVKQWSETLPELVQLPAEVSSNQVKTLPELVQLPAEVSSNQAIVKGLLWLRQVLPPTGQQQNLQYAIALKLHEEYGFSEDVLTQVAQLRKLNFDAAEFRARLSDIQLSKFVSLSDKQAEDAYENSGRVLRQHLAPPSDDIEKDSCVGQLVEGAVVALLDKHGSVCSELRSGEEGAVVLSDTSFHGGYGDRGSLISADKEFQVTSTRLSSDGHVLHVGRVNHGPLVCRPPNSEPRGTADERLQCVIDTDHRHLCSKHNTAAHLFLAAVRRIWRTSVPLRISLDDAMGVVVDVATVETADSNWVEECERTISTWISASLPVVCERVSGSEFDSLLRHPHLTWTPGLVYPLDNVGLVRIGGESSLDPQCVSLMPCSAPHVASTIELECVRIMGVRRNKSSRVKTVSLLAGKMALEADTRAREARKLAVLLSGGGEGAEEGLMLAQQLQPMLTHLPHADQQVVQKALQQARSSCKADRKTEQVDQLFSELDRLCADSTSHCAVYVIEKPLDFFLPLANLLRHRTVPCALLYQSSRSVHVRCWMTSGLNDPDKTVCGDGDWLRVLTSSVTRHMVTQVKWHKSAAAIGVDISCRKLSVGHRRELMHQLASLIQKRVIELLSVS